MDDRVERRCYSSQVIAGERLSVTDVNYDTQRSFGRQLFKNFHHDTTQRHLIFTAGRNSRVPNGSEGTTKRKRLGTTDVNYDTQRSFVRRLFKNPYHDTTQRHLILTAGRNSRVPNGSEGTTKRKRLGTTDSGRVKLCRIQLK